MGKSIRHKWVKEKFKLVDLVQNQNSLLVQRQNDNIAPGALARYDYSLALSREVNLDTQSSDISAEVIRESGRSFQSLKVVGKKLCSYVFVLAMGV